MITGGCKNGGSGGHELRIRKDRFWGEIQNKPCKLVPIRLMAPLVASPKLPFESFNIEGLLPGESMQMGDAGDPWSTRSEGTT